VRNSLKPFNIELALLRLLHERSVRYLCIGRQACILYGLPVQTFDYDLWVHPDANNIAALVSCAEELGLCPSITESKIPRLPKFRLENDAVIDIWKVRAFSTAEGDNIEFEDCFARRQVLEDKKHRLVVAVPHIDDLIRTKKISPRSKDIEDIKALEAIRATIVGKMR
jgi:hypothetical protein